MNPVAGYSQIVLQFESGWMERCSFDGRGNNGAEQPGYSVARAGHKEGSNDQLLGPILVMLARRRRNGVLKDFGGSVG